MKRSEKAKGKGGQQKKNEATKRKLLEAGQDPTQSKLSFGRVPAFHSNENETLSASDWKSPDGAHAMASSSTLDFESVPTIPTSSGRTLPSPPSVMEHNLQAQKGHLVCVIQDPFTSLSAGAAERDAVDIEIMRASDRNDASSSTITIAESGAKGLNNTAKDHGHDHNPYSKNIGISSAAVAAVGVDTDAEAVLFVAPGENASLFVKKVFLERHPVQPTLTSTKLPFDPRKAFYINEGREIIHRKWLSFCHGNTSLYCSSCKCFDARSQSPFVSGFNVSNRKDIYTRISRHEQSATHREATSARLAAFANKDLTTLIDKDLNNLKERERAQRRSIVERIIDICIFVGMQGIGYRGDKKEGVEALVDRSVNHGNFLELALILSKYDPVLKAHIDQCIEIVRKRKKSEGLKQGRGSLVTFMSKSIINRLLCIIGATIQRFIANDVLKAGIFSVQVDSTQDVSVMDQLAIVVRYVTKSGATERLITLVVSHDNTGLGLYNKLKEELRKLGLEMKNIVACSFDGASNMSGCFKGLQTRLKEVNSNLMYTHCAGHCLNLVITDCTESCKSVKALFGPIETGAVFLSDSYKRMDVWSKRITERSTAQQKLRRLRKIGKTRWWSKPKALRSVIDAEDADISQSKLIDFLLCMEEIKTSASFDAKTAFTAEALQNSWRKFENVLLAVIMLEIFDHATPVSNALQSQSIDYLVTFTMVRSLMKKMESFRDKFDSLVGRTERYVQKVNEKLSDLDCEYLHVQDSFSVTRTSSMHRSSRSSSSHRVSQAETDAERDLRLQREARDSFRIQTFLVVVDQVIQGLDDRFNPNEELLKDLTLIVPKKFKGNPDSINVDDPELLKTISYLAKVDSRKARIELQAFSDVVDELSPYQPKHTFPSTSAKEDASRQQINENDVFFDDLEIDLDDPDDDGDCDVNAPDPDPDDEDEVKAKCEACGRCISCIFKIFIQNPVLQDSFPALFTIYKFALTLPTTQVSCERMFSKLKIIKTRLRATLGQDILEPLLFVNVEREIALSLDKNKIINELAASSALLSKLFM